jgi:hypothetical protein
MVAATRRTEFRNPRRISQSFFLAAPQAIDPFAGKPDTDLARKAGQISAGKPVLKKSGPAIAIDSSASV